MIIGIAVYDKVDLLDVTGPHEMLGWMEPKPDIRIIADKPRDVTSRDGFTFKAKFGYADIDKLDVLWVPGGDPGALKILMNGPQDYLNFLKRVAADATWVCSVCEGALLLAKAGLLDGYNATTHWYFIPCLKDFKKVKVVDGLPRFVVDRNRLTGGGISSGLDESLKLIELIAGTAAAMDVQQSTQYYPNPPVTSSVTPPDKCEFQF
jgi:transcriptional regulator GlxA family with amidase domain